MRKFYTDEEIDDLTENIRKTYETITHQKNHWCLDIQDLMKTMFGLNVVYENIAEDDRGKIGFYSDGVTPLWIFKNGSRKQVIFPEDTVVLDSFLLRSRYIIERNKTLGHEFGHKVMFLQAPGLAKACYRSELDTERETGIEELHEKLNLAELYADKFYYGIFMPVYLLERVLKRYNNGEYLTLYGRFMLSDEDKIKLQKMADRLGVSYDDLFHRFKNLKMFNKKPASAFTGQLIEMGVY